MGRGKVALIVCALVVSGCQAGIPGVNEGRVEDVDRWKTVMMKAYRYPETCGAGPWVITFPAREVRWGRQIVVQVRGPRRVPIGYEVTLEREGSHLTKRRVMSLHPDLFERKHARCHVAGSRAAAASAEGGSPPAQVEGSGQGGAGEAEAGGEASGETSGEVGGTPLVLLSKLRGGKETQYAFGVTFFAGGRPARADNFANEGFRLDYWHGSSNIGDASASVRIKVWLKKPSDLEGIELVFRDQELMVDRSRISMEEYERTYAARVEAYEGRREERQRTSEEQDAEERAARQQLCAREPDHWKCREKTTRPPPLPKAERQPPAPPAREGVDVQWVPGYWQFDASAEGEYVWVPGTYKIEVAERAEPDDPPPAAVDDGQQHEVGADVPPKPPPRDETIPPPPAIDGATWVAGHYRLEGNTWVWVPGTWQVPPEHGARRIMPRVETRGKVRIYIPGGWIDGR